MVKRIAAGILLLVLFAGAALAEETTVYQPIRDYQTYFNLEGAGWIVESFRRDQNRELTLSQAQGYLSLARRAGVKEVYVYLVNSSRTIDLDHPEKEPPLWPYLQECYPDCTLGCLKIDSVETYRSYFYRTDHHWNYRGSYEGYKDVIRMLLGEDEPLLEPLETIEFPFVFNGSYYKRMGRTDSREQFTVYRFEYPEMSVWINQSRRKTYGKAQAYFDGRVVSDGAYTNHYGEFYGGDNGLIQFSTGRPEKESVMIISNSYSNPLNMLIASHFNNTVVVDPRLYEKEIGKEPTLGKLIQNYGVTKILLLGDASFFWW